MQKQEAYKVLGVKEDASKNEIEKRYATILRKYRAGNNEGLSEEQFGKITEAYNLLMGYIVESKDDGKERKRPNPILQKLGIDEDKLKNILYYYKIHIIVGIIMLVAIISTIRGCVNRVDPDLYVVFMGEVYCNETEQLEEDIKSRMPTIEAVSFENILISEAQEKQDPQVQMAMLQKAMVLIAVGDVDVLILDKAQFEKFAKQGAFMKLDEIVSEMGLPEDKVYREEIEEENKEGKIVVVDEGIYGINVKNSKILTDAKTAGEEMIAAISIRAKHYDNAVEFIKLLVNTSEEAMRK
ncbi:MAG: DnaJ domain-containing protein [Firmicutes bacterium]|nr:DnaJ domain-containing protein [Bacillota bacterium]